MKPAIIILLLFLVACSSCPNSIEDCEPISLAKEPPPATLSEPLTVNDEIVTKPGHTELIKVGFFNPTNEELLSILTYVSCENLEFFEVRSDPRDVSPQDFIIINVLLRTPFDLAIGTYNCHVELKQNETLLPYTKQLKIEIIE